MNILIALGLTLLPLISPVIEFADIPEDLPLVLASDIEVEEASSSSVIRSSSEITDNPILESTPEASVALFGSIQVEPLLPEPTITPVPELIVATVAGTSSYDHLYQRYADQFGIEKNTIALLAQCESGHRPEAVNGIYGGMFQFSASTWSSTRSQMGLDPNPDLRFEAQESIHTAAFKIANGGIRAWTNCGRRYGLL